MENTHGSVSINTENIFPIIKKWLYSEKDIFIREIVSNAGDAISKLRKLANIGEAEIEDDPQWKIEVIFDKDAGTLTVTDNGIGMTAEEVDKYINQIAFSGAKDFIEKYEGKADADQIIGHFGLGFYSSFMVSDKVEIDSLSFVPGSKSVHWESSDGMTFSIGDSELQDRGTYITMHLSEDAKEFLEKDKLSEVLDKYFSFFPYEIYLTDAKDLLEGDDEKTVVVPEDGSGDKSESESSGDGEKKEKPEPKPINDTNPLWNRNPNDISDDDYKKFYRKTFSDYEDPLFWIHLNVDYPFNLKGILFFPKIRDRYERFEGQIKVYYNQVFVADNIKEVLPEFLMLLKGCIDCPDLPLNVSRSFLQNDGYVNKISAHITKKVADKLNGLFSTERENYCRYWDDINPFVKYGCLKDEKLYDKIKDSIIYKTTSGEYFTSAEYLEKTADKGDGKTVYYTDDKVIQSQYIKLLTDREIPDIEMNGVIDSPFMQFIEYKVGSGLRFTRVDSDVANSLKDSAGDGNGSAKEIADTLAPVFRKTASKPGLNVTCEKLSVTMPAIMLLSEQARRLSDMMRQFGNPGFESENDSDLTLCLNANSPAVQKLLSLVRNDAETATGAASGTSNDNDDATGTAADKAGETTEGNASENATGNSAESESGSEPAADKSFSPDAELLARQIYGIALLAHKPLDQDAMSSFIDDCSKILERAF